MYKLHSRQFHEKIVFVSRIVEFIISFNGEEVEISSFFGETLMVHANILFYYAGTDLWCYCMDT